MFEHLLQEIFHPFRTGSIKASSKELVEMIVKTADVSRADSVVELGAGTGVITEKILRELSPKTIFFALEINDYFVRKTKERFPQALIYEDSAVNIRRYLKKHGLKGCDVIISSLPWSLSKKEYQETLLEEIVSALNPKGRFVAFAYVYTQYTTGRRFYRMLKSNLNSEYRSGIIRKNVPPAFVYCYTK